jgi:Protein of unknown function (DUF3703)
LSFTTRIRPYVDHEVALARERRLAGDFASEFMHLERAHVLGQTSTVEHLRTHCLMLSWGMRNRNPKEIIGQVTRILGAAVVTPIGRVPIGNTGGSNISPFKPMPIPADLQAILDSVASKK